MFHSSNGPADQLTSLLSPEALGERLDNGMTLLHLCCLSNDRPNNEEHSEKKEEKKVEAEEDMKESPCYLQLMKSSRNKKDREGNRENENENEIQIQETKAYKPKDIKELVRILLQKGADPTIICKNGFSPLHVASYKVKIRLLVPLPLFGVNSPVTAEVLEWFV